MKSMLQHFTPKHRKKYEIRVDTDLFKSVSVLGCGSSLIGGRVQFGSFFC